MLLAGSVIVNTLAVPLLLLPQPAAASAVLQAPGAAQRGPVAEAPPVQAEADEQQQQQQWWQQDQQVSPVPSEVCLRCPPCRQPAGQPGSTNVIGRALQVWQELTSPSELTAYLNSSQPPPAWPALDSTALAPKLRLVEFYATWCPACRAAAPEMAEVAGVRSCCPCDHHPGQLLVVLPTAAVPAAHLPALDTQLQLHAAGDLQSPPRCHHLLCHAVQPTRTCGSTAALRVSTSTGRNPWCANLASPRSPLCCCWHPTAAHSTASGHQDRLQGTQSPSGWQCCSSCSSSRSRRCQCCRQRLQRAVLRSSPRSSQHHLRSRATAAAQQQPSVGQHQSRPAASCRLA